MRAFDHMRRRNIRFFSNMCDNVFVPASGGGVGELRRCLPFLSCLLGRSKWSSEDVLCCVCGLFENEEWQSLRCVLSC